MERLAEVKGDDGLLLPMTVQSSWRDGTVGDGWWGEWEALNGRGK